MGKLDTKNRVKRWAANTHLWESASIDEDAAYIAKAVFVFQTIEFHIKNGNPISDDVIKYIIKMAEDYT